MSGTTSGSAGGGGASILREYMIKLGYQSDEPSQRKFQEALKSMTATVVALGSAVVAAAAGVISGVATMANAAASLYFVAERTKAHVADIKAVQRAYEALGGTAEGALSTMEGLAQFIKESPSNKEFFKYVTGKEYTDAATGVQQLGAAFRKMAHDGRDMSIIFAQAKVFGIAPRETLLLMQHEFEEIAEKYKHMQNSILGDQDALTKRAHQFKEEFEFLGGTVSAFATRFGDEMATRMLPSIERMTEFLKENTTEIKHLLGTAAVGISKVGEEFFKAGVAVGDAISGMIHWYRELTPESQNIVKLIGEIGGALLLLGSGLAKSPIFIVALAISGLIKLLEDYQKFEHDGSDKDTIFPWKKWEEAWEKIKPIWEEFAVKANEIAAALGGWEVVLKSILAILALSWGAGVTAGIIGAITAISAAIIAGLPEVLLFAAALTAMYAVYKQLTMTDKEREEQNKAYENPDDDPTLSHGDAGGLGGAGTGWLGRGMRWMGRKLGITKPSVDLKDPQYGQGIDLLMKLGRSREAAAGIMSNYGAESGLNPGSVNSSGHAGIGQWSYERQRHWYEWLKLNGRPPLPIWQGSVEDQIRFGDWETRKYEPTADALLNAAKTPEAGSNAQVANERPEGYVDPQHVGPFGPGRAADARLLYNYSVAPAGPPPTAANSNNDSSHTTVNNNITVNRVGDNADDIAHKTQVATQQATNEALSRNGRANAH